MLLFLTDFVIVKVLFADFANTRIWFPEFLSSHAWHVTEIWGSSRIEISSSPNQFEI